jgi:flagellar basal-body rod protein FlgB
MSIDNLVFDETAQLTNKLMEMSMERQKVIANNLANVNTPGYIRQDIDFEKKLASIVESGNIEQLEGFQGKIVEDDKDPTQLNGNNVVAPKELNSMMQNSVYYNLLTKAFSTKMSILKNSIK